MTVFGLIIIGDEILSGRRSDKHLPKVLELLKARGLQLSYAEYVGDDPERISATLARAFASGDVVFSTGGIGATPDDHTRQCAARALGRELAPHPEAQALILQRMHAYAQEQGRVYDSSDAMHQHRMNMGVFPQGAQLIPNPFNQIPGFQCGTVYFVPGFPVMAWPMMEWVLDTHYADLFQQTAWVERASIVYGSNEALLTPLMERIEQSYPGVKVFSLPSVDHPEHGRHIELGVKGEPAATELAYAELLAGVRAHGLTLGPELVQA